MEGVRTASVETMSICAWRGWLAHGASLAAGMLLLRSVLDFIQGVPALGELGDYFHVLPGVMFFYVVMSGYGLGIAWKLMVGRPRLVRWAPSLFAMLLAGLHLAMKLSMALNHCSCITFREAVSTISDWSSLIWATVACFAVVISCLVQKLLPR